MTTMAGVVLVGLTGCDQLFKLLGFSSPDIPAGVTVTAKADGSLLVAWSESDGATGYEVVRDSSEDGEFADSVYTGSSASFTDTGLSAPFPYYYRVRATNSSGESDFSEPAGSVNIGTYDWGDYGTWIAWGTNETANFDTVQYYTISGSSLVQDGDALTAWVSKLSGSPNVGFGVIFGYVDSDNYWEFIISENGWYDVWQKDTGTWYDITGWVQSASVIQGFGETNELQVAYTSNGTGELDFYINTDYVDTVSANLVGGALTGFAAEVGNDSTGDESFPDTPVFVAFAQDTPVYFPSVVASPMAKSLGRSANAAFASTSIAARSASAIQHSTKPVSRHP